MSPKSKDRQRRNPDTAELREIQEEIGMTGGDEEHYLQVVGLPLSEEIDYCLAGKIRKSRTIAGLALANMRLKLHA